MISPFNCQFPEVTFWENPFETVNFPWLLSSNWASPHPGLKPTRVANQAAFRGEPWGVLRKNVAGFLLGAGVDIPTIGDIISQENITQKRKHPYLGDFCFWEMSFVSHVSTNCRGNFISNTPIWRWCPQSPTIGTFTNPWFFLDVPISISTSRGLYRVQVCR